MTLNDNEPSKKSFLVNFSQFLAAAHILRVNCDEMAGYRQPAYNFFALNVNFCNLSLDPLGLRRTVQAGIKDRFPLKKWLFLPLLTRLA